MMHNPPRLSELLRDEVIFARSLPVAEAASWLAMSRIALSRVLNGKAAISADLGVRLDQAGPVRRGSGSRCRPLRSMVRNAT